MKPIILIDNGHGRETPGKRSPDGSLLEWQFNRDIAIRVVDGLRARGYNAVRIVTEDRDVALSTRAERANCYCRQYGKDNVLLVSIHGNASGNGGWMTATGWEAWTTVGKTRSDALANCLYEAAAKTFKGKVIRKDMSDGDPDKEKNWTILYKSACAAVLTENFFYDTKGDLEFMQSKEGRDAIVYVHIQGIIDYIKKVYG